MHQGENVTDEMITVCSGKRFGGDYTRGKRTPPSNATNANEKSGKRFREVIGSVYSPVSLATMFEFLSRNDEVHVLSSRANGNGTQPLRILEPRGFARPVWPAIGKSV